MKRPGTSAAPATHADYPQHFRRAAVALLLCARRAECGLAKLPEELLLHLLAVLARRTYWELDP